MSTKNTTSKLNKALRKTDISHSETPVSVKAGKHLFLRYLMDNEYAEEMKCKCGFVIWSCQDEKEAKKAIEDLGGDINYCG